MPEIFSKKEIAQFIADGYVILENAFACELANEVRNRLWDDLPVGRNQVADWPDPVIRLGMYSEPIFVQSLNTPQLYAAYNQLVGEHKWLPCRSVGSFPVRFPSGKLPTDTGLHVDAGFAGEDPGNYFEWRVNIHSKGRGLLLLALYSDITAADAPTILYKKSHRYVAELLQHKGNNGWSFLELAAALAPMAGHEKLMATGKAGTVYLCHPFMVHAAQAHTGKEPKFMAQPPLLIKEPLNIADPSVGFSPVEQAIRLGLKL